MTALAPHLSSFKLKLVAYFVALSLVPMAATYWGFSTVADAKQTQQVTLRQASELRIALAVYQDRLTRLEAAAERLASSRPLRRALEQRDRRTLGGLVTARPSLSVVGPAGALLAGRPAGLAARLPVEVLAGTRRLGEVVASLPLDDRLLARLRREAALQPGEALVLLDRARVVAASPPLRGRIETQPGASATVRIAGSRYRVLSAPALPGLPHVRLAVLTAVSQIDAADARTRGRLLAGLLASLALIGLVAYLQGRSIVRNLRRFAVAARAVARGSLSERVPVRGHDEFAALGAAFNEMAEQLEARLAELEAERARVREAQARFGQALAATHDVQQLLRVVAAAAAEATGARACRLVSPDGSTTLSGDEAAEGERLVVPLVAAGERFGTLELVGERFSDEQRLNAASLAAQAIVALDNARLHRLVERQALVDGLTGLANRRACAQALHAELARAERYGTRLSVVLADLDGFKAVNDAHGHAAGDKALGMFAAVVRETLRESDHAGRWGGEEFLLLLPGADEEGAAQLAERIRVALAARSIERADGSRLRVTASFGVAEHVPGASAEQLVAAADEALYRAKRAGKNRVERAGNGDLVSLAGEGPSESGV